LFHNWLFLAYDLNGDHAGAYERFIKSQKSESPKLELFQTAYVTSGWRGIRQKRFELQKINEQNALTNYYGMANRCALLGDRELPQQSSRETLVSDGDAYCRAGFQ